jgi:hypothetical protein
MARAPVSKTDCFPNNFKAHSEKYLFFAVRGINRLASIQNGGVPSRRSYRGGDSSPSCLPGGKSEKRIHGSLKSGAGLW